MAENRVQLVIEALDKTKPAFASLNSSLGGLLSQFNGIKTALAAAFTAAPIAALTSAIRNAAHEGEALLKVSQQIGISVEKLSELKYAAELSEAGIEELTTGVKFLSKALTGISEEGKDTTRILKALGVTSKDPYEALLQIADAFARMKDGAGKTKIALELFGRGGIALIPMLNEGAAGILKMSDAAKKMGATFTEKTAKAADEFNDNITRLKTNIKGHLLPVLNELIEKANKLFYVFSEKGAANFAIKDIDRQIAYLQKIVNTGKVFGIIPVSPDTIERHKKTIEKLDAERTALLQKYYSHKSPGTLWQKKDAPDVAVSNTAREAAKKLGDEWSKVKRDLETDLFKLGLDEFDKKIADFENKAKDLKEKFKGIKGAAEAIESWFSGMKAETIREREKKQYEAYMKSQEETAQKTLEFEKSITEAKATELEKRFLEVEEWAKKENDMLLALYGKGTIDYQTYKNYEVEITRIAAEKKKKIEEESERAKQEALMRLQRAQLESLIDRGDISKEEGYRRAIELTDRMIQQYEELRQKQNVGSAEWLDYGAEIEAMYQRRYELQEKLKEQTGTLEQGWQEGFRRYVDELKTNFQHGVSIARQAAQAMEQAFSDFFFDAFQGKMKSLGDYLRSFLTAVQRQLANIMGQQITGGIIGGIKKIFGFADGGIMTSDGPLPLRRYASGGIAYHPQLAVFGEGSMPEAFVPLPDGRRIPVALRGNAGGDVNVVINMENKTGLPLQLKHRGTRVDEKTKTKAILIDLLWTDPEVRNTLAGRA